MTFPSKIFFNNMNHDYRAAILKENSLWLLPFHMVVANYFCYKKVRRTMHTAIVSYLLKCNAHSNQVFFNVKLLYQTFIMYLPVRRSTLKKRNIELRDVILLLLTLTYATFRWLFYFTLLQDIQYQCWAGKSLISH